MIVRIERCYAARWRSEATKPSSSWRSALSHRTGETPVPLGSRGFTLIEMILVMALLVIGVSFLTPHLSGFFRGRTLQSEARQMLSMVHSGQSRAISGGVPVILWFDKEKNQYGLEEEPGYSDKDPKAESLDLDKNLKFEIPEDDGSIAQPTEVQSDNPHMQLPHITFLSDGSLAEGSPKTIKIVDVAGPTLSLTQARDRNQYEIAATTQQ
jgi:prepilin-type N-terminal cleavage/methylation domain-containing protein